MTIDQFIHTYPLVIVAVAVAFLLLLAMVALGFRELGYRQAAEYEAYPQAVADARERIAAKLTTRELAKRETHPDIAPTDRSWAVRTATARAEAAELALAVLTVQHRRAQETIATLRGKLRTANRLRQKWYRLWRTERERVRFIFGDLWDVRKPSRRKLATMTIEPETVPTTTGPIPLVPPVIAHEWAEPVAA